MLTANLTITVSPIEESLVELLQVSADSSTSGSIDASWLRQTEKLIADAIVEAQRKSQEQQESLGLTQQQLTEQVETLQTVVAEHHRLMNDVRLLLKNMAKQENILGLQVNHDYNHSYEFVFINVLKIIFHRQIVM